jgi:hypothetical protein
LGILRTLLAVIAISGVAVTLYGPCRQESPPRKLTLTGSRESPSDLYRADIYVESVSGDGRVWQVVNIQPTNEAHDSKKGRVFVIVGLKGIVLEWSGDNTLIVRYAAGSGVYDQQERWGENGAVHVACFPSERIGN